MKKFVVLCLVTVILLSAFAGCEQPDIKPDENPSESGQHSKITYEEEIDDASTSKSENLMETESVLQDHIISFSQKYTDVLIEYEPLLDAYIDMVTKANNYENINSSDYDKLPIDVFDWLTQFASQHNSFGKAYAIKDLNGDDKDELIILDGAYSSPRIYAVFTITDGNITPVIMSAALNEYVENIAIAEDGRIYRAVMLKCESYYREIITLMPDGEISLFAYSYEDYRDYFGYDCEVERYKILNGESFEITAEELSTIEDEYADEFSNINKLTANTGFKINYLFEYNPK